MVARNEICWADFGPPAGRRPVCILTRTAAAGVLEAVTCAPITRTIRGIASEVEVGVEQGLPSDGVVICDGVITIPKGSLDPEPVGALGPEQQVTLDRALRFALDLRF